MELEKAKSSQQRFANARRRPVEFQIGDKVWLKVSHLPLATTSSSKALALRYRGPFKIIGKIAERAYKLKLPPSMLTHPVFHVSLLKPWSGNISNLRDSRSAQLALQGNEYAAQGISKHKKDPVSGCKWSKVLWMDGTCTWEPEDHPSHRLSTNSLKLLPRYSKKCIIELGYLISEERGEEFRKRGEEVSDL